MNRRAFAISLGASLLLPGHQAASQRAPSPGGNGPQPIDLGEGIVLIDFRIHPGEPTGIIGEIRNERGQMIDAPVISVIIPTDREEPTFTWISPIIPVIKANGSVPVYGTLPDGFSEEEQLLAAKFSLCTHVESGPYTEQEQALKLDFRITHERYRHEAFKGTGVVKNTDARTAPLISVRGIVRDTDKRVAGTTTSTYLGYIKPLESREFTVWMDEILSNKANPVPLIAGLDYSVDITAGTRGSVIARGCSFGKPWD